MNLDLMVMHARHASLGADPKKNKNNHPFTSSDRSIALVHNGKLPEHHDLRKKYEVRSDTDSEVLLRIFEWASINTTEEEALTELPTMDWITASKVLGLKKVFSYINEGYMAAAVAERGLDLGERTLWLFRNTHRPIYIIDIRDKLGQIFFCSTHQIWRKAISEAPQAKQFIGRRWCIEMPSDEIWTFSTSNEFPIVQDNNIQKIDITKGHMWKNVEEIGSPLPIIGNSKPPFSIISYLNDLDEPNDQMPRIAYKKRYDTTPWPSEDSKLYFDINSQTHVGEDDDVVNEDADECMDNETPVHESMFSQFHEIFDMDQLGKVVSNIKDIADDIQTTIENKITESSLSESEYQSILEELQNTRLEMQGTLAIASR